MTKTSAARRAEAPTESTVARVVAMWPHYAGRRSIADYAPCAERHCSTCHGHGQLERGARWFPCSDCTGACPRCDGLNRVCVRAPDGFDRLVEIDDEQHIERSLRGGIWHRIDDIDPPRRRVRCHFFAPAPCPASWLADFVARFSVAYGIDGAGSISDVRARWDALRDRRREVLARFRSVAAPYARELNALATQKPSRRARARHRALQCELVDATRASADEVRALFPMTTIPPTEVVGRTPADEGEMIFAIANATQRRPIAIARMVYGFLVGPETPEDVENFCQAECARFRAQMVGRRDASDRDSRRIAARLARLQGADAPRADHGSRRALK